MNEKVNIQNLIDVLAKKHGMTAENADEFVKDFFQLIETSLETDKYVKIRGLGTFKLITVGSRESINVNTGERFEIPNHTKVSFTPEPTLKDLINKPFSHFDTVPLNDHTVLADTPTETVSLPEPEEEEEETVEPVMAEPQPVDTTEQHTPDTIEQHTLDTIEQHTPEPMEVPTAGTTIVPTAGTTIVPTAGTTEVTDPGTTIVPTAGTTEVTDPGTTIVPTAGTTEVTDPGTIEPTPSELIDSPTPEPISSPIPDPTDSPTPPEPEPVVEEKPKKPFDVLDPDVIAARLEAETAQEEQPERKKKTLKRTKTKDKKEDKKEEKKEPQKKEEDKKKDKKKKRHGEPLDPTGLKIFIVIVALVTLCCGAAVLFMYYPDMLYESTKPAKTPTKTEEVTPTGTDAYTDEEETLLTDSLYEEEPIDTVAATTTVEEVKPVETAAPAAPATTATPAVYDDAAQYEIVGTETTHTIQQGETLTKVSLKYYGTKGLWTYIVKHNKSRIKDPDNVPYGTTLEIPKLQKK